jgi:putative membrane protein
LLTGSAFDKKYLEGQLEDHQKSIQLLQHEINGGQDKELRQFATETLPVVTHHLEMVKQLQGKHDMSSSAH